MCYFIFHNTSAAHDILFLEAKSGIMQISTRTANLKRKNEDTRTNLKYHNERSCDEKDDAPEEQEARESDDSFRSRLSLAPQVGVGEVGRLEGQKDDVAEEIAGGLADRVARGRVADVATPKHRQSPTVDRDVLGRRQEVQHEEVHSQQTENFMEERKGCKNQT